MSFFAIVDVDKGVSTLQSAYLSSVTDSESSKRESGYTFFSRSALTYSDAQQKAEAVALSSRFDGVKR